MGQLNGGLNLWIVFELTSFDTHHERYEAWFTRHEAAYSSELLVVPDCHGKVWDLRSV
jgi:hypothetical protein